MSKRLWVIPVIVVFAAFSALVRVGAQSGDPEWGCVADGTMPCPGPTSSCAGAPCDDYWENCRGVATEETTISTTVPWGADSPYGKDGVRSLGQIPCVSVRDCDGDCTYDTVLQSYFCAMGSNFIIDVKTTEGQIPWGEDCYRYET